MPSPVYWTRDIVGAFADAWQRITGVKHTIVCDASPTVVPIVDVAHLLARFSLRSYVTLAVTATGTYDCTSILLDEDFVIKTGYVYCYDGTFTFTRLLLTDNKGNSVVLYDAGGAGSINLSAVFPAGLRVPAGCKIQVVVDSKAVNGHLGFDGCYYFTPAVVPQ